MYAVIDIGSNTMRLNIYEHKNNKLYLILSKKITAGLAGYVNKKGNLTKKGVDVAINSLKEFKMILNHINVNKTYVFATASLRNVNNSKRVTRIIEEKTKLNIDLISGKEEATLGYIGASMMLTLDDGLLIDIGGGSTELVLYEKGKVKQARSLSIGSLSLYKKYITNFLPTEKEIMKIRKNVLKNLRELDDYIEPAHTELICGVGGTIRATRELNNDLFSNVEYNKQIETQHLKELFNLYLNESHQFIKTIIKVAPDRLHTILPGMIILDTLANHYNSKVIEVSDFGIREGYLYTMINKEWGEK